MLDSVQTWGEVGPVVELTGIRKRYGAIDAVKGVDLIIQPGEVIAILGPNGAGKTTSIHLMLGLRKPTAGQVRLSGLDPTDRRARSRCGVMLQEPGLPGILTIKEIVNLFRSCYPSPLGAEAAIRMAGLEERVHRPGENRHASVTSKRFISGSGDGLLVRLKDDKHTDLTVSRDRARPLKDRLGF